MIKSHQPPPHLVNGHFFTGGLWYLNGILSNEFLSLYKCIPQPNDTWFGILDQSFAPAQHLMYKWINKQNFSPVFYITSSTIGSPARKWFAEGYKSEWGSLDL